MGFAQDSDDKGVPAVKAENTAGGVGVSGASAEGRGIEGTSRKGVGVVGISEDYRGIEGRSTNEHGILGQSVKGAGVAGVSEENRGVIGRSTNEHGVFGQSAKGAGVAGVSDTYRGVSGRSKSGQGVWGTSETSIGAAGFSDSGEGVRGTSESGVGVAGKGPVAGAFDGKVTVSGDIECQGDVILAGADYAEAFSPAVPEIDGGTVVVLADDGRITPCCDDYDNRVAGVVSGGQGVRPGITLDRHEGGIPVAMMGKIWTRADASTAPITVGDLLTTSATPGHAMPVTDRDRALGAVIGKALTPLSAGCGWVRVLVAPS